MDRWLRWTIAAWLVVIAVLVLPRWVLHGPVHARSLSVSVSIAAGATDIVLGNPGECERSRRRDDIWSCDVFQPSTSGFATYRVAVPRDGSCWHARISFDGGSEREPPPRKLDGCVHLWQWSLSDPFP